MSERVSYIRWPKQTKYTTLPGITMSTLPISPTEYFYLNERGLTFYGNVNMLRCTVNLSKIEPGKKILPTLDVTKEGLKKIKSSYWNAVKLKMPVLKKEGVKELMIKSKEIDKALEADEELKSAEKAMWQEHQEYVKEHPNLSNPYTWTPKTNAHDYLERFCKVCDEVFGPYIDQ